MAKPNTRGSLAMRPKSYVITVCYKASWPMWEEVEYNYTSFDAAKEHIDWLIGQVAEQNGKRGLRHNV